MKRHATHSPPPIPTVVPSTVRPAGDSTHDKQSILNTFRSNAVYAVTAETLSCGRSDEEIVAAALAGGVKVIQLRDKTIKKSQHRAFIRKIRRLKKLTTAYQALLILNDYLDLALVEADGVHLGQTDSPLTEAFEKRRALGREDNFLIGLSTHNLTEAKGAEVFCREWLKKEGGGIDLTKEAELTESLSEALFYINLGPIYATQTKQHIGYPPLGPKGFSTVRKQIASSLPVTVMGGIKSHHLPELVRVGVSQVAMITELTTAPDVKQKVQQLLAVMRSTTEREQTTEVLEYV